jgi:Holliday junction DNA helicase RuvA
MFRLLVNTVSGIGPKIAPIFSAASTSARASAASDEITVANQRGLQRLRSASYRTANKLGKTSAIGPGTARPAMSPEDQKFSDAVSALLALGFKQPEAHDAVRAGQALLGTQASVEHLVRAALKKGA